MDRLLRYKPAGPQDDTIVVLQAFLNYLPEEGRANLQTDILHCKSDEEIWILAKSIVKGLLYPLRATSATTSIKSGIGNSIQNSSSEVMASDTLLSKLQKDCLERDGQRCVVTGLFDRSITLAPNDVDTKVTGTECAHIVPFCLGEWDTEAEHDMKTEIWVNLNRFFPSLRKNISFAHENINDHRNALTLHSEVHALFRCFNLALEATEVPHQYRIQNYKPNEAVTLFFPVAGIVSLTSSDPRFDLPSPGLLQVHATMARILHVSGQATHIEKIVQARDEVIVLAKDGSTDVAAMLSTTTLGILGPRACRRLIAIKQENIRAKPRTPEDQGAVRIR